VNGVTQEQMETLHDYARSPAFSELERLVLDYAVAMTATPVNVPDELFAALRARLDEGQIVEITAAIAWENYRARFNHALGIGAQGFSEGAFCVVPERELRAQLGT
jgi:4-carboxymuconolactone decarboxylase